MKIFIYILIATVSAAVFIIPVSASEHAEAYVLIEAETGEILLSRNENEQFPISSLAKIMTLLIIAEELEAGNITLADSVPAPAGVMDMKAPVIWLNPGEVMPLGELVKAVIISSANDATLAIAEYIAGSGEKFAAFMNERAAELGMENTFFADPGGFTEETVSTARDVAVMTAALFNDGMHNSFGNYFTTRLSEVRKGTERETQLVNTNRIAQQYEGILGGKAARLSLANCAERGGMRLVAVVLGAKDEDVRDNLCTELLDTGFENFEYFEPETDALSLPPVSILRGVEKSVAVAPAIPVRFISHRDEADGAVFEAEFGASESIEAPVETGQVLGRFTVRLGDKVVFECDIVAVHCIEKLTFKKSLEFMTKGFFGC
ncbi:MAG: D-alanyl-D-alanine carboxypeptidase [Oscillospiraceae bacterium]|jgi:D-alanyl-D-alanine carboxypeptidase (penicillin-binding protein 5/6)|nr:D-alanyl-D-alanine carboxypeptidase [Oscillospiraceae bacterium]